MPYIDPSWTPVDGQEGLYLESYTTTNQLTGGTFLCRILHSADGYCFYDLTDEYWDEDGNQIPEEDVTPEMRLYYQYMSLAAYCVLTNYISVPVQPGFEIVSTTPDHEVM